MKNDLSSTLKELEKATVFVGNNTLETANSFILQHYANAKKFILVDENTLTHCFPIIQQMDCFHNAEVIQIESGEANKNIEIVAQIWSSLKDLKADRKSLFINLGGGVISDMGGFIAATYKRGIDFINFPTTLLSQVDASVGGKLGIDFDGLKNQIGLFRSPNAVFILPDFLKTLNHRQVLSGYGEVIKHALISTEVSWEELQQINLKQPHLLAHLIARSIQTKNKIVQEDPFEKGLRKALNFGHTIGHAIESYSLENDKNPLLHGEAVAIGMITESYLSNQHNTLSTADLNEICTYILSVFGKYELNQNTYSILLELMGNDKKNTNGTINFTFLKAIGTVEINQTCSFQNILDALDFYRELL